MATLAAWNTGHKFPMIWHVVRYQVNAPKRKALCGVTIVPHALVFDGYVPPENMCKRCQEIGARIVDRATH